MEPLLQANPHKRLRHLYGARMMTQYRGVPLGELSPHAYAIAEQVRKPQALAGWTGAKSPHRMQGALVQGSPSVSVAPPACCWHTPAHSCIVLPAPTQPVMHPLSAEIIEPRVGNSIFAPCQPIPHALSAVAIGALLCSLPSTSICWLPMLQGCTFLRQHLLATVSNVCCPAAGAT